MSTHILLVGCGRMGAALFTGWRAAWPEAVVTVIDPAPPPFVPTAYTDSAALPPDYAPDLVVFAVKPQQLAAVLPAYMRFVSGKTVFLSIAAGKPIAAFEAVLGAGAALVRAMPNTPAAIGKGISVLVANAATSTAGRNLATQALQAAGQVAWVDDESLMDAVTALSGSGPAYVFYLVEVLAEAGQKLGLPAALALSLARQTVIGSGALLEHSSEAATDLRASVTSPGGTTAAALAVLMQDEALAKLFAQALEAARERGRQLAG